MENLVGKKIELTISEKKVVYDSIGVQTHTTYAFADPMQETELRESIGGKVRIWFPNTMGTADYRLDRTNVHIDKTGMITKVNKG
jgi:hypothetical protein